MTIGPFDLNLRHLKALLAVRKCRSVIAAAEAVNISQPALTQGIVKLERQFGHALFERRTNGMAPTPVGDLVADRVEAAIGLLSAGAPPIAGRASGIERRLTMTQLRAFLALVDAGSFTAAGHAPGLSQTAIHRAVRDLESGVQSRLVERRGRGVALNAAGQRFARGARLAIGELNAIFVDLGLDSGSSMIALGTMPLARPFLIPEAMSRMLAEQPAAQFRVFEGSWSELVEQLRDGLIDMLVGELPPFEISDLLKRPLYHDPLVVVAGRQHPLVGKGMPTLETLASFPWIVGPVNSPLRAAWEQLFAGRELPSSPIECGSVMIIGRLLTSANFLTVLAPDQAALQIRSGLLAQIGQPLSNSRVMMGITTRHSWRPATAQRRFIAMLEEAGRLSSAAEIRQVDGKWNASITQNPC
jgi:LysR family transcriptional regulator of gallate degradation